MRGNPAGERGGKMERTLIGRDAFHVNNRKTTAGGVNFYIHIHRYVYINMQIHTYTYMKGQAATPSCVSITATDEPLLLLAYTAR